MSDKDSAATNGKKTIDRVMSATLANRKKVVVPEWGDLELYFGALTSADLDAINERLPAYYGEDRSKWPNHARSVCILILKAELEDGSQAFDWSDRFQLTEKVPVGIITRLLDEVAGIGVKTIAEAEGKSDATPTSTTD